MVDKPSFWRTLPGILTGVAAVIGAIGTLIIGLSNSGLLGQGGNAGTTSPPPSETNSGSPSNGFRIVDIVLRADPFDYRGPCPARIEFSGRISVVGGSGLVSYRFLRSDGANAPVQTLEFESPGSQNVATSWRLGGPGRTFEGWQQIQTFEPEQKTWSRAHFSLVCDR